MRLDTEDEVARLLLARQRLSLDVGTVIAVPIPQEAVSDGYRVEEAIQQALMEARSRPDIYVLLICC
jgi:pseudouridine-5'-phosphate glycosidase